MLKSSVDHLLIRDGQLFSYGWGFCEGNPVSRVVLITDSVEGRREINVEYGRQRADVRDYFPEISEAENSGFLILAGIGSTKLTRAFLRWELADGEFIETDLAFSEENRLEVAETSSKVKHYGALGRKALALLRRGGAKIVFRKLKQYLSARPKSLDSKQWKALQSELQGKSISVVIDQDMGGGSNIYRNQYINTRTEAGEAVLLFGFHVASLQYFVEVFNGKASQRHTVDMPEVLLPLLAGSNIQNILYNCAVSFRKPLAVVNLIVALKIQSNAYLLMAIHDYLAICPSQFLINSDNKFCGVPSLSDCRSCLAAHQDSFVSISGIRDIVHWRREWMTLLGSADEVRLFSNSSYELMSRAYPTLPKTTWRVVPHALHTNVERVEIQKGEHLHIGVVGAIGKHKGSQIIANIAREIERQNSPVKITVIGTLEQKVPKNIVTVIGPYEAEKLTELVKNSGANVFLFSSILPETFSYVSNELVAMNVPFACFNLGAPADLARSYSKGLVLDSFDEATALAELEKFWAAIYA